MFEVKLYKEWNLLLNCIRFENLDLSSKENVPNFDRGFFNLLDSWSDSLVSVIILDVHFADFTE